MLEQLIDIEQFLTTLKKHTGYDFSGYSVHSLKRRITKILLDTGMDFNKLILQIKQDISFREKVVKKITVNTTDFFRDADLWLYLKAQVFPHFTKKRRISIWHPGCSTGQEVYSMMILLHECRLLHKAEIFASDLNEDVLEIAKKGEYRPNFNKDYFTDFDKVLNSGENNRKADPLKYFSVTPDGEMLVMKDFLKVKPTFMKLDLVRDENPFQREFDIIVCRNVIIYFNQDLQTRVLELFYRNLNTNGCLVLGRHETIMGEMASRFTQKEKVYMKNLQT